MVPARMVAVAITPPISVVRLGNILPRGLSPLVVSRAGFLTGGVVAAVVGMVVPASAVRVAAWLLLAPG